MRGAPTPVGSSSADEGVPFHTRSEVRGIAVVYYHGVVERFTDPLLERNFHTLASFSEHVQHLKHRWTLCLPELAGGLVSPPCADDAVVVTFDDGYANNLLAIEILAAARIPVALFVSTGALGPDKTIWTVELALLLLHGVGRRVAALGGEWSLADRQDRILAYDMIRRRLKLLPAHGRRKAMDAVRAQFPPAETARLLHAFPTLQMLTWKQVAELASAGVEIGSHGVDHELHHGAQPGDVREGELRQSKRELETRLRHPCRSFAYPNGDFTPESPADVRAAGYAMAFTIEPGTVTAASNPYLLPRCKTTVLSPTPEGTSGAGGLR